ncbi:hypothetical protein G6F56_012637 [Rhizopus delemar]|nr:hypothetical protein G6F56_012637 [Rhizopus delemar]
MSQPNVYSISNTHFYCSLCVSDFDKSRQSIKQHQESCEGAKKMIESFTLQPSSASLILDNLVPISSAVKQISPELDDCDHYSVGGASTGTIEGTDYSRFVVQEDAIYYDFSQDQASPDRTTLFSGQLYHLSRAHAIPRAYFNKSIKVFNNYVNGIMDPLQSTYSCQKKNKKETFPVEAITYVMCRNGCKMFSEEENDSACEWCEAEATKRRKIQNETKRGRMDIKYLPSQLNWH